MKTVIFVLVLFAAIPASAKHKHEVTVQQGNHCWYSDGSEGRCKTKHFYASKKWWVQKALPVIVAVGASAVVAAEISKDHDAKPAPPPAPRCEPRGLHDCEF